MHSIIKKYSSGLLDVLAGDPFGEVPNLGHALLYAWENGNNVYFCGNGGSAGNANHLANDFIYGAGISNGAGLRAESLSANTAVLTCLANDIGSSRQLSAQTKWN